MTPVEQIKSRLSVVDVVSSYIKLVRAGSNFKAVCPFHSEKSPSFFVSPARDTWHCFGCQKGGDQFSFVEEIEGIDFREALHVLAQRAGVELRREDPQARNERARLFSLMELAARFYQAGLSRFPNVQRYLAARGVSEDTIGAFRIGYAPPETSGWRVFADYAISKGYTAEELHKTGLVAQKQAEDFSGQGSARFYDRFRNRVMFPIGDANGRVVGFGGRIYETPAHDSNEPQSPPGRMAPAKYINSPQTVLYDKSRILYAFDKAKVPMRKADACIVVEGYMDAVMAHQAGTPHVVAVSGTALTPNQLTQVRRLCGTLVTAFDMDMAGESATRRSLDSALSMGFDVKAVALPSGKDPADMAENDSAGWRTIVDNATDIISYFLEKAVARYDMRTLDGKRGITASVLPLITRIPQEVEKAHWVSVLASRLGVREESVWEDLKKQRSLPVSSQPPHGANKNRTPPPPERTRMHTLQERVLGLLYRFNLPPPPEASEDLFSSGAHKALFTGIAQGLPALADNELRTLANKLMFEAEFHVSEEEAPTELQTCLLQLRREYTKEQLARITESIRRAEEAGNTQQVSVLADEFRAMSQQLVNI